jgi:hypothetical protein
MTNAVSEVLTDLNALGLKPIYNKKLPTATLFLSLKKPKLDLARRQLLYFQYQQGYENFEAQCKMNYTHGILLLPF